jgi:predicted RNase H-like HicB family nuclease
MSKKWKSSSRKAKVKSEDRLDRPFDPRILRRAKEIASQYRIVLEPNDEVGYMGNSIEMPNAWGDGKTPDACVRETREVLVSVIATMLERGEVPPIPGTDEQRTEQVNIRVTPTEKRVLEEAARTRGFRGVSDFVRSTTLSNVK